MMSQGTKRKLEIVEVDEPNNAKRFKYSNERESAVPTAVLFLRSKMELTFVKLRTLVSDIINNSTKPKEEKRVWINCVHNQALIELNTIEEATSIKTRIERSNFQYKHLEVKYVQWNGNIINDLLQPNQCRSTLKLAHSTNDYRFFPFINSSVLMEKDSYYLMTRDNTAGQMTNWFLSKIVSKTDSTTKIDIVDGTAGLGGDTYAFAANKHVNRVFAIETNSVRFTGLVNNVFALGLDRRVIPIKSDFVFWLNSEALKLVNPTTTCIYIDAPWGGPSYKDHVVLDDLFLDQSGDKKKSLVELCKEILTDFNFGRLLLKLPYNFKFERLPANVLKEEYKIGNIVFLLFDNTIVQPSST